MKFEPSGFHPTDDRSLNLIEQINQTLTYLASVQATRWLFQHHPDAAPFRLNLGTTGGTDIESIDGSIAALVSLLGVAAGSLLTEYLPIEIVHKLAAVAFIAIGALMLFGKL